MSKAEDNKAIVGRWFTEFWGKTSGNGSDLNCTHTQYHTIVHRPAAGD